MAKVLLFGPLSDVLETEAVNIQITDQVRTVNDGIMQFHECGKDWQKYLNAEMLQVTVNRQFGDGNSPARDSDEIAFISRPGQF